MMKKKKLSLSKLSLGKETISDLATSGVKGGTGPGTGRNCSAVTCVGSNCFEETGQAVCHVNSYTCPPTAYTCASIQKCPA